MFYKNWPYWLKGGTVILILATLLFVILFLTGTKNTTQIYSSDKISYSAVTPLYAYLIPNFLKIPLNTYSQSGALLSFAGYIAQGVVLWFVVGVFIGIVYGKIKNIIKK